MRLNKVIITSLSVGLMLLVAPSITMAAHSDDGCGSCHTPHNAVSGASPLWNGNETTQTFSVYTSNTLDAAIGQPDGSSKLCLSCHDGVTKAEVFADPNDNLGTNLASSHPISFVYDSALAGKDTRLNDPESALSGLPGGKTVAHDLLDSDKKVQCASCHDVHTSAVAGTKFLRYPYSKIKGGDRGLTLCRTCHNQ